MYSKRAGTSGICGQLYESKLVSLLYFRAIHDDRIIDFQLASNVDHIGAFDDICFKAEVEGFDKPVAVFIQAKHKENKKQPLRFDLTTYFISYLKIRQYFDPSKKDLLFKGTFDEVECLFVLYTPARDAFSNDSKVESNFGSILKGLIGTGGTAKQPYKQDKDVEFLCKVAMKERIISLAERIAEFINDDSKFQMMLTDELVLCYHVILAKKVFDVSELQPDGYRIASFRRDFFDTHDEYLILFKNKLLQEILKKRTIERADIELFFSEFLTDTTDALKLSKLIGTVITYNNGKLECDKQSTNDFCPDMKPIDVSRSTVNKAVEMAANEILYSPKFKLRVPSAFGNKDITVSGSATKKKRRINYLASKIIELLDNNRFTKIITIDNSLGDGFLQLNGGIAGAIGNIFVLHDNSKLMKITNNKDSLEILAKQLYERLNEEIGLINQNRSNNKISNLCEYKFCFKVNNFPKLLLECSEQEEKVRDFFNKLVIYSNQADEKGVEESLKDEIEENQLNQPNYFQVKTDAIFAKYHDEIQKWWMQPEQASYLTRENDFFQKAKSIIKDQLLSIINIMYRNKINHVDYTFTESAVRSLKLQDQLMSMIITTENIVLTVVKLMQQLKNKDHTVLDLEYIINLPPKDRNVLRTELRDMNKDKVLIIVYDEIQQIKNNFFENIAEAVLNKKTIIVTKHASVETLQKYFPEPSVHDQDNSLVNMSEESQKNILENVKVIFQGTEVSLGLIVDNKSKAYVNGDVLHKIISNKTIEVGKLIVNSNYHELKHYHVERRMKKGEIQQASNQNIMYYLSNNSANERPTSVTITACTPDVEQKLSDKTFEEDSNVLTAVVKTVNNTVHKTQSIENPDETLAEKPRFSNAVNNTSLETQSNDNADESLKDKSSLTTAVVKTLNDTSDKIQSNENSVETLEQKSSPSTELVRNLNNTSQEKQKNGKSDKTFENKSESLESRETQRNEVSDKSLEDTSSLSATIVNTFKNIADETQSNDNSDKILEDKLSLSTAVDTTLNNALVETQNNDNSDDTLKEKTSLSTAVVKTPNNTSEEIQKKELPDELRLRIVKKSVVTETVESKIKQKNEVSDETLKGKSSNSAKVIETLSITSDIPEDVVLITAEPGIGKSTLLTHLSIKTKQLKPEVWILRINLLEYSEEFSKWKEAKIAINLIETLKLMCQVILRQNLGRKKIIEITLEEKDNGVYLKHCTADPLNQFELNLFLHFYCEREVIFLFDGFDEICPHYTDVVIKCINCITNDSRKHRIWITSRSYNEVKTVLEKEFGLGYEIDNFSRMEMVKYLYKFWDIHLRLEDLNSPQLENVKEFLEYMSAVNTVSIHMAEPLYEVISIAALYISYEIKNTVIPLWKYNKKFTEIICYTYYSFDEKQTCDANPLFLYLAASYVVDNIKKEHKTPAEWYLDLDIFTVYKSFLENKIKRRYQEKNEINIYNSDIITTYEKEIEESIFNHKRLGAYAIFNEYIQEVFSEKDLAEIEKNIKIIEKGGEKTGLIDSVANGIPIFTHMSFTEYFAVEYVCDCLYDENNYKKLMYIVIMFTTSRIMNIRKIFDHKIKIGKVSILENYHDMIFNWIWSQTYGFEIESSRQLVSWALLITVVEDLKNWEHFFNKTIEFAINNSTIADMVDITELSNLYNLRNYVNKFKHFFLKY